MNPCFVLVFSVQALKGRNIIGVGEALPIINCDGLSAIASDISPSQGFVDMSWFYIIVQHASPEGAQYHRGG